MTPPPGSPHSAASRARSLAIVVGRGGSSARVRGAATAAAAALGVAVGLGVRGIGADGWSTALSRLAVVALRLRGLPEFVTPDRDAGAGALLGGAQVAIVGAVWGAIIGAVVNRSIRDGSRPRTAAAVVVIAAAALAGLDGLLPAPLRLAAGTLVGTEWGMMVLAVSIAAWLGARSSARELPAAPANPHRG